jgi:hypothetical protein
MTEFRRSGEPVLTIVGVARFRSWRSHLGVFVAILAISAPVVFLGGSATASAATRVVDGAAQVVAGTTVLSGIACHGHDNCIAVGSDDGEGVVVPITDGVPGTPEPVTVTDSLAGVTCPTKTFCVAVGSGPYTNPPEPMTIAGYVVPITDGMPTDAYVVPGMGNPDAPDLVDLYGVGCSSPSNCWIGGSSGYLGAVIATFQNGYPGNLQTVGESGAMRAVVCRDVNCLAVGDQPAKRLDEGLVVFDLGSRRLKEQIPSGVSQLYGASCRNTTCIAVGTNKGSTEGVILLAMGQTLHNAEAVSDSTSINGVACSATTFDCLAVGANSSNEGVVAGIYDGTPGTAQTVAGTDELSGVACPTDISCLVVGANSSDEGVLAMIHLPPR